MDADTINIHFVRAELQAVADPARIAAILEQAGVAPAALQRGDARVTTAQYRAVCHGVRALLDDELAGRGLARLPVGFFSTQCKFAIHGDTLLKCLARSARFSNLFEQASGIRVQLETDGDITRYVALHLVEHADSQFLIERNFLNIYKYLVWVAGRHLQLRGASFRCGPPAHMEDYRQLFYCDLQFRQARDCLVFQTADLLHAPAHHEKDLAAMMEGAPQSFWTRPPMTRCYAALVRRVLFGSVEGDAMDFETVAAKLDINMVTLRRRLKKEGVSFQEIKDSIRRDKAISLMHDASKTISDIAFELGYSDPSAFYRAFRQWVGSTPNQYRAAVTR